MHIPHVAIRCITGFFLACSYFSLLLIGNGIAFSAVCIGALIYIHAVELPPLLQSYKTSHRLLLQLLYPTVPIIIMAYQATRPGGPAIIMLYTACAVIFDTAAYSIGSLIGYHRLAPSISPHKTVEGALGGTIAVGILLTVLNLITITPIPWQQLVGHTLGLSLSATIGDLFESAMKRRAGVKDSGTLFPGHGGVLDRIDSICGVALYTAISFRSLQALIPYSIMLP